MSDRAEGVRAERRVLLWYLLVVALIAVCASAALAFVLGTQHHDHASAGPVTLVLRPVRPGPAAAPRPRRARADGRRRRSRAAPRTSPSVDVPSSVSPSPRSSAPTAAVPVVVPDPVAVAPVPSRSPATERAAAPPDPSRRAGAADPCAGRGACAVPGDGGVTAAIDRVRARHGLGPVAVSVTAAAQACAVSGGDPGACPTPYATEVEAAQDGRAVVSALAADPDSAVLDPQLSAVQVGWAHGASGWVCAVLAG